MNKKIIIVVLCFTLLISVTGCGMKRVYPKVFIDTDPMRTMHEIDIGDKYEYVNFTITETDSGKEVNVHFERRTN